MEFALRDAGFDLDEAAFVAEAASVANGDLDGPKGGSEARDAARYRWLRDPDNYPTWSWWSDVLGACDDGQSFDYAIDAAMQAQASGAEVRP